MTDQSAEIARLRQLCDATDMALWAGYTASVRDDAPPGLRFPSRKPPGSLPLRVSEQEARHLFCSLAPGHGYSYTLETPTESAFVQSGLKATRARFDASLLGAGGERLWNVEFKHGGISPTSTSKAVYKDIEKLLVDPGNRAWFHTIERINNATINYVIDRIRTDVKLVCGRYPIDSEASLSVHICVLDPELSIHREVDVASLLNDSVDLPFEHRVGGGNISWNPDSGWSVRRADSAQ